jgi:hypothetical protein
MALDFTNRDPKDPNGIFTLDTTSAADAWVKDGDWSQIYYSESEARKAGANNKIRVATAVLNDGRKYNVVVGADGKVISEAGDSTGYDAAQQRAWQQQQNNASPPGGLPTRTINGQVFQWNPQTQAYDIPTGQAPGTATKEWRTEGTPDGQGGYDNSRPVMAAYVNGQRTGETRQPTAKELEDWNLASQMTRNPGGKTDAQIAAERPKETREPIQGNDGKTYTKVTRADPATGKVETFYENANGVKVDLPGEPGKDTRESIRGKDGKAYVKVTKVDPATGKSEVYYEDESGQKVPPPQEKPPGAKMPKGVTPPTSFQYGTAAQTLADFWKQLNDAVTRGEITGAEAAELFAPYHQQAQTAVTEQTNIINTQRGIMSDETSQRGQDLSASTARGSQAAGIFNNAMSQMTDLNKTVAVGSDAAGRCPSWRSRRRRAPA